MKKSTLAMKVISVLAAMVLVVTTCFIPETSKADSEDGTEQGTDATQSTVTFNCRAEMEQYLDKSDVIVVHNHIAKCYKDGDVNGELICPIQGTNVQSTLHVHNEDCYVYSEEPPTLDGGVGDESTNDEDSDNVSDDNNNDDDDDNTSDDSTGGESTGGDSTGGESTGGDSTGGDSTGGESTGGDSTGGESTGGESTGGESTGGESTGGESNDVNTNPNVTPVTDPTTSVVTIYSTTSSAASGAPSAISEEDDDEDEAEEEEIETRNLELSPEQVADIRNRAKDLNPGESEAFGAIINGEDTTLIITKSQDGKTITVSTPVKTEQTTEQVTTATYLYSGSLMSKLTKEQLDKIVELGEPLEAGGSTTYTVTIDGAETELTITKSQDGKTINVTTAEISTGTETTSKSYSYSGTLLSKLTDEQITDMEARAEQLEAGTSTSYEINANDGSTVTITITKSEDGNSVSITGTSTQTSQTSDPNSFTKEEIAAWKEKAATMENGSTQTTESTVTTYTGDRITTVTKITKSNDGSLVTVNITETKIDEYGNKTVTTRELEIQLSEKKSIAGYRTLSTDAGIGYHKHDEYCYLNGVMTEENRRCYVPEVTKVIWHDHTDD